VTRYDSTVVISGSVVSTATRLPAWRTTLVTTTWTPAARGVTDQSPGAPRVPGSIGMLNVTVTAQPFPDASSMASGGGTGTGTGGSTSRAAWNARPARTFVAVPPVNDPSLPTTTVATALLRQIQMPSRAASRGKDTAAQACRDPSIEMSPSGMVVTRTSSRTPTDVAVTTSTTGASASV